MLLRRFSAAIVFISLFGCGGQKQASEPASRPQASSADTGDTYLLETSLGSITFLLDWTNAPNTAANFARYVEEGFYDGRDGGGATVFHRVISGFMIQGGGYTEARAEKDTHSEIALESQNGLSNLRGSIAMARTADPDSATSQFFINHADNLFLDFKNSDSPGYAVFGHVTAGLDIVDAIAAMETDANDWPHSAVVITSIQVISPD